MARRGLGTLECGGLEGLPGWRGSSTGPRTANGRKRTTVGVEAMSFAGISRPKLSAAARWLAPALLVAIAPGPAVAHGALAPTAMGLQADEPTQQALGALSVLRDAAATQPQRERACKILIELCELAQVRTGLSEILAGPLPGASEQLLATIAQDPDAPPRLYPLVAQRLSAATPEEAPRVIAALGSF